MGIQVYRKGAVKDCNLTTYFLNNKYYNDYSCPFCNLVLNSDFHQTYCRTNQRCNCGGNVSINGQKTQAQVTQEQESNSQSRKEDQTTSST